MRRDRLTPLDTPYDQLQDAQVAVIGAGATGSHMIQLLARLGADIHILDRDYVAPENLATSALYTEDDIAERRPKAFAARDAAQAINSDPSPTAAVTDVTARTIGDAVDGSDILLDGTDNIATRRLINQYSVREAVPWVHAAALGDAGTVMPVIPGETACFACTYPDLDPAGLDTCATSGISPGAAATVAAHTVRAAATVLDGDAAQGMLRLSLHPPRQRQLTVEQRDDCRVCRQHRFDALDDVAPDTVAVCGEDQFQIRPRAETTLDLSAAAKRLPDSVAVERYDHLLRITADDGTLTVFRDGRAIVAAESSAAARTLYDRYVGR